MADDYGWRMTPAGLGLISGAIASGAPVAISTLVLGDGGGIIPPATAPGIVREVWRTPVAAVRRAADNPLLVEVQAVVPAAVGPFVIREAALLSADGTVVALCRRADLYKGGPGEAHVIDLLARIVVSDAAVVTIAVDSGLYATLAAVDAALATHAASRNHPSATTNLYGFTRLATVDETQSGQIDNAAVHPAAVRWVGVPPGMVAYVAAAAAPDGWLPANGATVSRAAYSRLFAAIGTRFGPGDGVSTFALPDLRGEFLRGVDGGRGIDPGRAIGSVQMDEFRSHNHSVTGTLWDTVSGTQYPSGSGSSGFATNRATSIVGGAETRPRNVAMLACIKY